MNYLPRLGSSPGKTYNRRSKNKFLAESRMTNERFLGWAERNLNVYILSRRVEKGIGTTFRTNISATKA
jgi:hypothetical protein